MPVLRFLRRGLWKEKTIFLPGGRFGQQRNRHIPYALFDAITFLAKALPKRSIPTWLELLFGAMLTRAGFVTEAYLAISPRRHWTSYYKWLRNGKWSWVSLGLQTAQLALRQIPGKRCFVVIDDTIVFRTSIKAPESRINHQHGQKANRPYFVRGQNWISLSLSISKSWRSLSVPILSRLPRATGNGCKLVAAKTLLRACQHLFAQNIVTLHIDSWYMRKFLLLPAQAMNYQVIGQARKDTAMFQPPPPPSGRRGRPRKYGDKITPDMLAEMPKTCQKFFIYRAWLSCTTAVPGSWPAFSMANQYKAVWVQMEREEGFFRQQRLILSTDLSLSPARIIMAYGRRWSIEDMFNQLKNRWGWKETWQQTRQVLHRWVQILSTAYALPLLLAHMGGHEMQKLASLSPWRAKRPITAGQVRHGLERILRNIDMYSPHF